MEKLYELVNKKLKNLEEIKSEGVEIYNSIEKYHNQIHQNKYIAPDVKDKLLELYRKGINQTFKEETIASSICKDIDELSELIIKKENSSQAKIKRLKKRDAKSAGLEDEIKNQKKPKENIIKKWKTVVVKMPKELDEEENWILAKIICFHDKVREYEVEDIDKMKNEKHGKQFMVSMKNVIELPGPGGYLQEFPRSHRVIALYPNTTCFYKASIIIPPSKQNIRTQYYLISFDNDNDAVRHVDAQYVLDAPNELK